MQTQKTIADLLNDLFQSVRHPDGREYSHVEVAEEVERRTNGELTIDTSSIGKIRAGQVKNPGVRTIEAFALFFGVDADYFFPNLVRLRQDAQRRAEDSQVRMALRATGIDATTREHLAAIIKVLASREDAEDLEAE
jgi:transcriptional regulator with XRE-family HTH domain